MATQRYDDRELLEGIRHAARAQGEPLTVKAYDAHREVATELASGALVVRRFGTWKQACDLAGVSTNSTRSNSRRWSSEELIGWVAAYLASPGSPGSLNGYTAWARENDGAPSGPTLRNSFPRWAEVRELASQIEISRPRP